MLQRTVVAKLGVWVTLAGAIPNDLASPVRGKASFLLQAEFDERHKFKASKWEKWPSLSYKLYQAE